VKDAKMKKLLLALALCAGLGDWALAQTEPTATIGITHAWARATSATAKTGVAYLTMANKGASDDKLIAVASQVADKAELHTTVMDNNVMKMRPLAAVDIKAGGQAELKPGGMHIMLIGLKAPLKVGDKFPVTLSFEHAGKIEVMVTVEKPGGMGDHAMPGMKM
jgi:periplasmic copper chaperone A